MRYIYQKTGPALREAEPANKNTSEVKDSDFYVIESQKAKILNHLLSGDSLTGLEALSLYNCWSLAQRVANLRNEGYQIITELIQVGSNKRVAKYSLQKPTSHEG